MNNSKSHTQVASHNQKFQNRVERRLAGLPCKRSSFARVEEEFEREMRKKQIVCEWLSDRDEVGRFSFSAMPADGIKHTSTQSYQYLSFLGYPAPSPPSDAPSESSSFLTGFGRCGAFACSVLNSDSMFVKHASKAISLQAVVPASRRNHKSREDGHGLGHGGATKGQGLGRSSSRYISTFCISSRIV